MVAPTRPVRLAALCAALPVLEAAVLRSLHFLTPLPLAAQVGAPGPWGAFHDLRWVWTFASSWWLAAALLVAAVAWRSAVDALLLRESWPDGVRAPAFGQLIGRTAAYTVVSLALMSPWATLAFAGAATGFSPFMLAAVIGSVVTGVLLPPTLLAGGVTAWPWRSYAVTGLGWLSLSAAALLLTFVPGWWVLAVAAAAGTANWWWWRLVGQLVATADAAPRQHRIALAWPGLACVALVLLAAVSFNALATPETSVQRPGGEPSSPPRGTASHNEPGPGAAFPTIYLTGFNSEYDGTPGAPFGPQVLAVQFSYRGLDSRGAPLPYTRRDTHQSLQTSADALARQVEALHARTGSLVNIVAASEGAMILRSYLDRHDNGHGSVPVRDAVLSSPLLRPARVWYPRARHSGPGLAPAAEVRALLRLVGWVGSGNHDFSADMPFLRSIVTRAPLYRDQALCPPSHIHTWALLPLEGALTVQRGPVSGMTWTAYPAIHGNLLSHAGVRASVSRLIRTGATSSNHGWRVVYQLLRGVGSAWQAPALPFSLHEGWSATDAVDPAFERARCAGS